MAYFPRLCGYEQTQRLSFHEYYVNPYLCLEYVVWRRVVQSFAFIAVVGRPPSLRSGQRSGIQEHRVGQDGTHCRWTNVGDMDID